MRLQSAKGFAGAGAPGLTAGEKVSVNVCGCGSWLGRLQPSPSVQPGWFAQAGGGGVPVWSIAVGTGLNGCGWCGRTACLVSPQDHLQGRELSELGETQRH